jgi:hypothetical protein
MDFTFSDSELAFAAEARAWLAANVPGRVAARSLLDAQRRPDVARDRPRLAAQALRRRLDRHLLAARARRPRRDGDRALAVREELDRAGAPYPPGSANVDMIGQAVLRHGTERRSRAS